jgi:hypothetical protein
MLSAVLIRQILADLHPVQTDKPLIRIGSKGDGEYLVPDDLEGIQACFSPGVNTISDFENECAKRGMKVFLADASVDGPALENEMFDFRKVFISDKTDGIFITMDDWIASTVGDEKCDLILQMDIENYEYKAINEMSVENLKRFRIIVIEFHGLDFLRKYKVNTFKKILSTHTCVHIHPNNCGSIMRIGNTEIPNLMEFTFLRKDRIHSKAYRTEFPHPLDADNVDAPTLVLPVSWHR